MRSRPRRRGLTLVELMVVLAVMSIIVVLVAPGFGDMLARQRVQAINAELVTDLQFARSTAIARSQQIRMQFRSNASMTCYTIHTTGVAGTCNCLLGPGNACLTNPFAANRLWPGVTEVKTVQINRSGTVSVSPSPANFIFFVPPNGAPNTNAYQIDVASSRSGALRTTTNMLGRPSICTPDGSIAGVPPCS